MTSSQTRRSSTPTSSLQPSPAQAATSWAVSERECRERAAPQGDAPIRCGTAADFCQYLRFCKLKSRPRTRPQQSLMHAGLCHV